MLYPYSVVKPVEITLVPLVVSCIVPLKNDEKGPKGYSGLGFVSRASVIDGKGGE